MTPLLTGPALGGLAGVAGGVVAAAASGSPDWTGLALFIGSISTLIGTIGGLIITWRGLEPKRRPRRRPTKRARKGEADAEA